MSRRFHLLSSAALLLATACASADLPTSADPAGPHFGKAPPALGDPTTEFVLSSDASLGLRPDSYSATYKHGVCGVNSKIFATMAASNSGDAIMHASNPKFGDRQCSAYPRTLVVSYGAVTETTSGQLLVDNLQNTTFSIPVGSTVNRAMNLADTRCGGLKWRTALRDGTFIGADSVKVTRLTARSWRVFNDGSSNRALCTTTGVLLNITVDFTITADRDMP